MRLIYVHRREWPATSPGASFSTLNAHALARQGVDTHLIVGKGSEQEPGEVLSTYYGLPPLPNLHIYPIRRHRFGSQPFYWTASLQARKLIRQGGADAVISRDPGFIPFLYRLKKWTGVPVFAEAHNFFLELTDDPDMLRDARIRKKYGRLEQKYLHQLDGLICILQPQADQYRRHLPSEKVHVAHPGVMDEPASSVRSEKIVGYVGGLQDQRDLETVFRAFGLISDPGVRLHIVGGRAHEMDALLQRIRAHGLEARVDVTGWIPFREMQEQISRFALGLVPMKDNFYNRYLTAPMKILDYLSNGIPTLATDLPSSREFVAEGKEGLFYPPGDAEVLARQIQHMLSQPRLLQQLSRGALKKAKKLSWDERAKKLIEIMSNPTTK